MIKMCATAACGEAQRGEERLHLTNAAIDASGGEKWI
jgi:hypothetical protein